MICDNLTVSKDGTHLQFAGVDTVKLAEKYDTPLYLMDEMKIRQKCRIYQTALKENFGAKAEALFASKACAFKRLYQIIDEEGLGIDVVSCGEIYTASIAGFDLKKAYFHSNNKTDADIKYAIEKGIGYFVADNIEEVNAIEREAARRNITQDILLRLTPGIDTHTYEAVATGKVDSKFGSAIETGQADEITRQTLQKEHINLVGFHCHLGSQIFDEDVFERGAEVMLRFIASVRDKYGYTAAQLDLGGGYGVRYTEADPELDIATKIREVADRVKKVCAELSLEVPEIRMEPGRSLVGDAGMTLYTVGTIKSIPGYKNYVSIDGGMPDNPRFALYKSSYTCLTANKMDEPCSFKASLVGRCCESGDIIQENVMFPESIMRNDIVAVLTTGAYNYSMASNYNKVARPPVVMLADGKDYLAVRRETFEDMAERDI